MIPFIIAVFGLVTTVAVVEENKPAQTPVRVAAQVNSQEMVDAGREDILTKKRYCERVKYRVKLCWDIKRVR